MRVRLLSIALLLAAGRVLAGTPLGGDDAGFVPPDAATFACENAVEKRFAKLIVGTSTCHVTAARMGVRGKVFDDEACEDAVRAKYDRATAGLAGCPACLDVPILHPWPSASSRGASAVRARARSI